MTDVEEFTVDSVSSFLAFIEEQKRQEEAKGNRADFLFRGQDTDLPLLPEYARLKARGDSSLNVEKLMLAEFERTNPSLIEFPTRNTWDRMALAQHHGLPTRLLDWTYSGTAALWFAVKPLRRVRVDLRDGVVWLLKPIKSDFLNEPKGSPFSQNRTWIFRPRFIAKRIAAQNGVFTIHVYRANRGFVPLEKNRHFREKLVKMLIPAKNFGILCKQLHACGVNYSTMFPDLDGLCSHLRWRYTSPRKIER